MKKEPPWYNITLDGWTVSFAIDRQDGIPVIAELQVTPAGELPEGGITTTLLRRIRVDSDLLAEFRRAMRAADEKPGPYGYDPVRQQFDPELAAIDDPFHPEHGEFPGFDRASHKRGRRHNPDIFYARAARAYVDALERGENPIAKVQMEIGSESEATARDVIRRCRPDRYGFLTATRPGKAGGELTTRALEALAEEEERKTARQRRKRRRKT